MLKVHNIALFSFAHLQSFFTNHSILLLFFFQSFILPLQYIRCICDVGYYFCYICHVFLIRIFSSSELLLLPVHSLLYCICTSYIIYTCRSSFFRCSMDKTLQVYYDFFLLLFVTSQYIFNNQFQYIAFLSHHTFLLVSTLRFIAINLYIVSNVDRVTPNNI